MIDDESPPGSWARHLATMAERQSANRLIVERNERIKKRSDANDVIAAREGVGKDYVKRVRGMYQ